MQDFRSRSPAGRYPVIPTGRYAPARTAAGCLRRQCAGMAEADLCLLIEILMILNTFLRHAVRAMLLLLYQIPCPCDIQRIDKVANRFKPCLQHENFPALQTADSHRGKTSPLTSCPCASHFCLRRHFNRQFDSPIFPPSSKKAGPTSGTHWLVGRVPWQRGMLF